MKPLLIGVATAALLAGSGSAFAGDLDRVMPMKPGPCTAEAVTPVDIERMSEIVLEALRSQAGTYDSYLARQIAGHILDCVMVQGYQMCQFKKAHPVTVAVAWQMANQILDRCWTQGVGETMQEVLRR